MINDFKQLDEVAMPVNRMVIPLNLDDMGSTDNVCLYVRFKICTLLLFSFYFTELLLNTCADDLKHYFWVHHP